MVREGVWLKTVGEIDWGEGRDEEEVEGSSGGAQW